MRSAANASSVGFGESRRARPAPRVSDVAARRIALKDTVQHPTSKYLNNGIEADHGALKRLTPSTWGFQSMKTAYAIIKGFEVMRIIRRRHCILIAPGVTGEVRLLFDLAA